MIKKVGMCFSRPFEGNAPLAHIGRKLPVYFRLFEFCQQQGWETYVLTRKTYQDKGVFNGVWQYKKGKFARVEKLVKIDLVYDRTGGVKFPLEGDTSLVVVNQRDFKVLCWNKWLTYGKIAQFMPQTLWVGEQENLASVLPKIKTDWVVLKPYNGLMGIGVFIGPKEEAVGFKFPKKYSKYIAQEFIDTRGGIASLVEGLHDLRVAVANGEPIWAHVRTPPPGSFKANVAQGGVIKEIICSELPNPVKKIVSQVTKQFYQQYDNPIYSLDFGIGKDGPKIFELNDQIGFPLWEMKARDDFLQAHIANFAGKLKRLLLPIF